MRRTGCKTACRSNGWKRCFLWMNQLGCADFASACAALPPRFATDGPQGRILLAGLEEICPTPVPGHRLVTSPPKQPVSPPRCGSFLVETSDQLVPAGRKFKMRVPITMFTGSRW